MRGKIRGFAAARRAALLLGVAMTTASVAHAEDRMRHFDLPEQDAATGIRDFAREADIQVLVTSSDIHGKHTNAVQGTLPVRLALDRLIAGTGVRLVADSGEALVLASTPPRATLQRVAQADTPARSDAPPAAVASPAPPPVETNDIVVTAQRRSEISRDVPISIISISQKQLEQANVQQLTDISKLTPAVRFENTSAFVQPNIRGVSTSLVGSGTGSNVGIYIDGFYSPNSTASNFQFLNVTDLQVLKGPQGTLFGRNTTGGAILVTTAKPSTDTHAILEASYGSFNAQRYQAYVTGGLTDKVAVDLEGLYTKGDGFQHDIATGNDHIGAYHDWSVRAGLNAQLSDRFSVLLRYFHNDVDDPTNELANAFVQNGRPLTIGTIVPGAIVATKPDDVAATQPISFRLKTNAVQLTGSLDLGAADLTSYTQYRSDNSEAFSDLDISSSPIFYLDLPEKERIVTQEFILASHPGTRLQYTFGLFYLDDRNSFPVVASLSNGPFLSAASTRYHTRSIAAYGDVTYQLTDQLFLTGGLRWTNERADDVFRDSGPLSGGFGLRGYPVLVRNYFTPRAVLRYKPDEHSSVYASFTQGTKAAIVDTNDSFGDAPIKPERITAYEVGYKYGAGRFSLDLAGYYYDYKNLQVLIPTTGGVALVRNAATSRIYGFEGQARYRFGGGFDLSAGAAYTDAKYRKFTTSQIFLQCLDFATCGSNFGLFPNATSDSSGFQMVQAPKFTATVTPSYTTMVARGELVLSGTFYHTSSFYFDTSQQFQQKAYDTLDLRAQWTDPSKRYTFAVYGNNVTDKRYRTQATANNFGVTAVWNSPATIGASVRARF